MRYMLIAALAVVLAASSAMAQIEKGDKEIQAYGFLFAMPDYTAVTLTGTYGYNVTEKLQLGGGPTITAASVSGHTETTLGLTFFGKYYLKPANKVVPYLCGRLYQYDIAPDDPVGFADMTFLEAGAGFKYFVSERIAWDVSGTLGFSLGEGDVSFLGMVGLAVMF